MKDKKRESWFPFMLDEFVDEGENKYQTITKIAEEIKRQIELSGERDDSLIIKMLEKFRKKKDEKNSPGSDR